MVLFTAYCLLFTIKSMAKNFQTRDYLTLKFVNPVVRFLTISDIIGLSSFGLVAPVFAVFITTSITGGSLAVIGIAETMYLLPRALFQIPVAYFVDKGKGERDDFWVMLSGSLIYALVPLLYLLVNTPVQLYLVQFILGLGAAMTVPTFMAIFTRHIDRKHEGMEWGVYQTLTGIGTALTAVIGGLISDKYGFAPLFISMSILFFIGSLFLVGTYGRMKKGSVLFG